MISVFELFKVGIGPSSSHTVGPMKAATSFLKTLAARNLLHSTKLTGVRTELFGSLALTGKGHGTDTAIKLGLMGETPEGVDIDLIPKYLQQVTDSHTISLLGEREVPFVDKQHMSFFFGKKLPYHTNGMRFLALGPELSEAHEPQGKKDGCGGSAKLGSRKTKAKGKTKTKGVESPTKTETKTKTKRRVAKSTINNEVLFEQVWYSVGGGFIVEQEVLRKTQEDQEAKKLAGKDDKAKTEDDRVATGSTAFPFRTGWELLEHCDQNQLTISEIMMKNEVSRGMSEAEVKDGLLDIWHVMQQCVQRGCRAEGMLPGNLKVKRRAPSMYRELYAARALDDPMVVMDWVNLYALAVNEENASGGRVVTAPTNGAAGIVPAVLHYFDRFHSSKSEFGVADFLLTAGAIGILFKEGASISGAEAGCQGEVGVACSMAAAGLTAVLGGTPRQVENAAEIGMEHNLGLTCDPVGGLVQVPCIERNTMGAIKAINAAALALRGDGSHVVSLDQCIRTMKRTGDDMKAKYKETSRGGLALEFKDLPKDAIGSVGLPSC